jgi:hypothetical protein
MAVIICPPYPGLSVGIRLVRDTDSDATPEKNALGTNGTVFLIAADNSLNAALEYLKIYDAKDATVGTTDPDLIFMLPISGKLDIYCPSGVALDNGLSFATVTTPGTAGTTSPTSDVAVTIMAQDS